jgi:hypothetical protein
MIQRNNCFLENKKLLELMKKYPVDASQIQEFANLL